MQHVALLMMHPGTYTLSLQYASKQIRHTPIAYLFTRCRQYSFACMRQDARPGPRSVPMGSMFTLLRFPTRRLYVNLPYEKGHFVPVCT